MMAQITMQSETRNETVFSTEPLESLDHLLNESDTCTEAEILEAVRGFVTGDLTLAQLEGLSAEELYRLADIGYDLLSEGKLEDARRIFEGLYVYNPFDSYFHAALGSVYQQQGLLEESFRHYESAVQLYAEDLASWANLGEVALELAARAAHDPETAANHLHQAHEAFSRVLALDPAGTAPSSLRARALVAAVASIAAGQGAA
ncbi:MAG: hypothetical protein KC729_20705 [Candidatus Eisenbacteria bacterium]|uniref:Tetratricopeptide repeat protein n=1 Tax=Eiseniibacteriota bacterium TaxID=2212470 RepID=A0A956M4T9_UNCEI|nr:hypothetical protein [Candidatus Eisenbacteria bacterium]